MNITYDIKKADTIIILAGKHYLEGLRVHDAETISNITYANESNKPVLIILYSKYSEEEKKEILNYFKSTIKYSIQVNFDNPNWQLGLDKAVIKAVKIIRADEQSAKNN